ncbi:hypothetical protein V500_01849 [Pseudogymnoascus sp. VKM F-4518 (FW-2643)]|nr:hypothetical protein V500_01849 [Pseudogymnoascus sp. VKM F-4518 (FW-2643)]
MLLQGMILLRHETSTGRVKPAEHIKRVSNPHYLRAPTSTSSTSVSASGFSNTSNITTIRPPSIFHPTSKQHEIHLGLHRLAGIIHPLRRRQFRRLLHPHKLTVRTTRAWSWRSDVSDDKLGMRCQGSGCAFNAPIENIDVLEMNFNNNPVLHWTIYKNRNYDLIGLDGKTYGNCFAYPYGDFDCPGEQGHRKFRCLTSSTASQLNSKK